MANNEHINRVDYGNETLMDISDTTAEQDDVLEGQVFYARNGARTVGTLGLDGKQDKINVLDHSDMKSYMSKSDFYNDTTYSTSKTADEQIKHRWYIYQFATEDNSYTFSVSSEETLDNIGIIYTQQELTESERSYEDYSLLIAFDLDKTAISTEIIPQSGQYSYYNSTHFNEDVEINTTYYSYVVDTSTEDFNIVFPDEQDSSNRIFHYIPDVRRSSVNYAAGQDIYIFCPYDSTVDITGYELRKYNSDLSSYDPYVFVNKDQIKMSLNNTVYTIPTLDENGNLYVYGNIRANANNNWAYDGQTVVLEGRKTDTAIGSNSTALGYSSTAAGQYSYAEGFNSTASASAAHAEGSTTNANGSSSHAEGDATTASGSASHAEGRGTLAFGIYSHAEGQNTTASDWGAHAEGSNTTASKTYSHAEGYYTTSAGNYSHSEGSSTLAVGYISHAEGSGTKALESYTHAEGYNTEASQMSAHAEGNGTKAIGYNSHAENYETIASGYASHAEGAYTKAPYDYMHVGGRFNDVELPEWTAGTSYAVGDKVIYNHSTMICKTANEDATFTSANWNSDEGNDMFFAIGNGSSSNATSNAFVVRRNGAVQEGKNTYAAMIGAHAEGIGGDSITLNNVTYIGGRASLPYSHSEGDNTVAAGLGAHAEGYRTGALETHSHAEGAQSIASGYASHAEGGNNIASTPYAHAEGYTTSVSGLAGHAEGENTQAIGSGSHAEGCNTEASAFTSHSEGGYTIAEGPFSHAEGAYTKALFTYMHAGGSYNNINIPVWESETTYAIGDKVIYGGTVRICNTANSDATFTYSKWEAGSNDDHILFAIGNGESANTRSNAFIVNKSGNGYYNGNLYVNCSADSTGGSKVATESYVSTALTTVLPSVTSSDNAKVLTVQNGAWVAATLPSMTGATSNAAGTAGLVPAPASADREKFLRGDGTWQDGGRPMVILSYGTSTWADFIEAYNNNVIVYCRASSNSNPASGAQTRMAFMAYVNSTPPTNVEFQYYRSVSSHSATQMGDQVFIYKLDKTAGWSVSTREAGLKQIEFDASTGLQAVWNNNKLTITTL